MNEVKVWEDYWSKTNRSIIGKFLEFYRRCILASAVNYYLNKFFSRHGIFIECGSGTAQTSMKIKKFGRRLVALDIAYPVLLSLKDNNVMDYKLNADALHLPFKDSSLQGIWNVGVMEHFSKDEMDRCFREFNRVLMDDGKLVLFWPLKYAPYQIFLSFLKMIFGSRLGFPYEPSRLSSKKEARNIAERYGFDAKVYFSLRDMYTFAAVVCQKRKNVLIKNLR